MNKNTIWFVVVVNFLLASSARSERVRWEIADGGNGHWYEAIVVPEFRPGLRSPIPWALASSDAQTRGGYLATITSAAENEFVFGLVDSPEFWSSNGAGAYYGPWLGGVQAANAPDPASNWSWVTGEPFDYTHWHAGEPNDYPTQPDENRINFFAMESVTGTRSPYWNDESDRVRNAIAYVVEYAVPEPSGVILLMPVFALLGLALRRR